MMLSNCCCCCREDDQFRKRDRQRTVIRHRVHGPEDYCGQLYSQSR